MEIPKEVLEDLESYNNTDTVVVVEVKKGTVTNVKSNNSCARIYIVDHDNLDVSKKKTYKPEFDLWQWPDIQI